MKKNKIYIISFASIFVIFISLFAIVYAFSSKSRNYANINNYTSSTIKNPYNVKLQVSAISNLNESYFQHLGTDNDFRSKLNEFFKKKISNLKDNELDYEVINASQIDVTQITANELMVQVQVRSIDNSSSLRFNKNDVGTMRCNLIFDESSLNISTIGGRLSSSFQEMTIETDPNPLIDINFDQNSYSLIENDESLTLEIINFIKNNYPEKVTGIIESSDLDIQIANSTLMKSTMDNTNSYYTSKTFNLSVNLQVTNNSIDIYGNTTIQIIIKMVRGNAIPCVDISTIQIPSNEFKILVNDVSNVTQNEINQLPQNIDLNNKILQAIRNENKYTTINDFEITHNFTSGDYNNSTFSRNGIITITSKVGQNHITGSFNFPLNLVVYEPIITFDYSCKWPINFNLGLSTTWNIQGHAAVKLRITSLDMRFTYAVPRNLAIANTQTSLWNLYHSSSTNYLTSYIKNWTVNWGANSITYTDVDSLGESVGMRDDYTYLDDTNKYAPIAPYKNNVFYYVGHRRNGKPISSQTSFRGSTPAQMPSDNLPVIWMSERNSINNNSWSSFWKSIIITFDNNCYVQTKTNLQNYRIWVSSLEESVDVNINSITPINEISANAR